MKIVLIQVAENDGNYWKKLNGHCIEVLPSTEKKGAYLVPITPHNDKLLELPEGRWLEQYYLAGRQHIPMTCASEISNQSVVNSLLHKD